MVKLFVFASRPILPRRPSSLFSAPAYYNVLGHCLKKFEMILVVGVGEGELPRKFWLAVFRLELELWPFHSIFSDSAKIYKPKREIWNRRIHLCTLVVWAVAPPPCVDVVSYFYIALLLTSLTCDIQVLRGRSRGGIRWRTTGTGERVIGWGKTRRLWRKWHGNKLKTILVISWLYLAKSYGLTIELKW